MHNGGCLCLTCCTLRTTAAVGNKPFDQETYTAMYVTDGTLTGMFSKMTSKSIQTLVANIMSDFVSFEVKWSANKQSCVIKYENNVTYIHKNFGS